MKCRVIGSDGIPTQDAEILRMVDTDDGPAYEVYLRDSDMVDLVGDELIVFDNPSGYLAEEVIDGRRTPAKYEGRVSWMPYSYGISTVANELDDEPVPGYRADGPTPGKIEWIFPTGYFREGSLEPLAPNSGGLMLIESIPNRLVMKTAYRNEEAKIFADYPDLRAEIVELEREYPAKVSEKKTDIRIPATVGADLIDRHNLALLASQYGFRDAQDLLRMLFEVAYYYRVSGINLTSTGQKQTSAQVGIVTGNETSLFVPGKTLKELTAQWAVVSAPDLIASHVPNDRPGEGFAENASYPAQVQERDYQRDLNEADKVRRQARQFRAALVVNTNPDAVNGAPIVTRDMIVLGGNSRVMTMQLLYQQGKGQEIKKRLSLLCSQNCFGVTEAELDLVARPVLVRMLPETSAEMGQAKLREFVRALNVSLTQELDRQDATVALARVVPESERRALMMQFYQYLTDVALPTFISKYNPFFVKFLFDSGLVNNQNAAANVIQSGLRKGALTPAGEQMVESVLFGIVFADDPRVVGELNKRAYNATRDVLGILIATGAKEGYSLIPAFRVGIRAGSEGKSAQSEGGLFAQPLDLPVLPKMILFVYEEFQTRPAQFRRIFLRYLEAIRSPMISPTSQAALFASVEQERLSPEWVFAWASGLTVDGDKVERRSNDFAPLDRIRDGARVSNPSYRQVINTSKGRFTTSVQREGSRYTYEQDLGEFGARKGSLDYPRLYQASALLELAQQPENLKAARALIRRALLDVRDLSQAELDSLIDLLYAERAEIPVLIPEIDEEPPVPVVDRDFLGITERFEEIPLPVVQTSTPELPSTAEELLALDVSEIEDRASANGMDDLILTQALQVIDDPSEEPTFNILGKVFYVVTETVVEGKKQLSTKQRQYKAVAEYLKGLKLIKDYRVNVSGDSDRDWKVAVALLVELFEAPAVELPAPVVEPPAPVAQFTEWQEQTAHQLARGLEKRGLVVEFAKNSNPLYQHITVSAEEAVWTFKRTGIVKFGKGTNQRSNAMRLWLLGKEILPNLKISISSLPYPIGRDQELFFQRLTAGKIERTATEQDISKSILEMAFASLMFSDVVERKKISGKDYLLVASGAEVQRDWAENDRKAYIEVGRYLLKRGFVSSFRTFLEEVDYEYDVTFAILPSPKSPLKRVKPMVAPKEPPAPVVEPLAPVRAKKQKTVKATRFELETARKLTTGGELSVSQIDAIRSFPRFWRYGSVLPSLENALVDFQSLGLIGYVEYPNPEKGKKRGLQRFSTEPDYIEQQYLTAIGQFVKRYYAKDVTEERRIQHSPDFYMDNFKIGAGPERKLEAKLRKELGLPAGNPGLVFAEAFKKNLLPEVVFEGLPERFEEPSVPAFDTEKAPALKEIRWSKLSKILATNTIPYALVAASFRKWFRDNGVKNLSIKVRRSTLSSGLDWEGKKLTKAEQDKVEEMTSIINPKTAIGFLDYRGQSGEGDIFIFAPYIDSLAKIVVANSIKLNSKQRISDLVAKVDLTPFAFEIYSGTISVSDLANKELDGFLGLSQVMYQMSEDHYFLEEAKRVIKKERKAGETRITALKKVLPYDQREMEQYFKMRFEEVRALLEREGIFSNKKGDYAKVLTRRDIQPSFGSVEKYNVVLELEVVFESPKKKDKTPPEVAQATAPAPVPSSSSGYVIKAGGNSMELFALPFYQLIPEAQRPAVFEAVDTWIKAVVKSQGAPKSKSATWAQIKPKREFNPAFYWDQQVRDDREKARIVLEKVLSPDFPLHWTELLNIAIVNFYAPEGLWPLPRRGLKYSKEERSWIKMHTFEFSEIQSLWQTVFLELKSLTRDQLVTFEDFYCSDEGYNYGHYGRMNCRTTTLAKTTPTNVFRNIYKNDRDHFSYHEILEGWKTPQELRDSRHVLDTFTMRARDMLAYIRRAKKAKIGIDDKPATRAEAKEYLEAWGFERFLKSILKADDRTSGESLFMSRIRRQFEELPEDQKLDIMLQASNTNRIKPIKQKAGMWPASIFYKQLFERLSKEEASWQRTQKALEKLGSKLVKSAYKSYRLKPLGQDFQLVGLPDQTIEETVDYFAKEYEKNKFREKREIAKQDKIDVSGRFKTIQVLRLLRKNALTLLSDYIDANKRRERIKEQDNKKKLVDMLEDTDYSTLFHYWQYRDRLTDLKPQKEAIAKLDALIAEEEKKAQARKEVAGEPALQQTVAQSTALGPRAKKVLRSHREIAEFVKEGFKEEYPDRRAYTEETREQKKKGYIGVVLLADNRRVDAVLQVYTNGEFAVSFVDKNANLKEPLLVTVERIMLGADVQLPEVKPKAKPEVSPADEKRAKEFTRQILPAGLELRPYPYTKKNGEVLEGSSVIAIVERLPREDFRELLQAAKKKRGFYIRGEQGFVIRSGNLDRFVADAIAILGPPDPERKPEPEPDPEPEQQETTASEKPILEDMDEVAEYLAEQLNEQGYSAKVWDKSLNPRVYVKDEHEREAYYEVQDNGAIVTNTSRRRAWFRDLKNGIMEGAIVDFDREPEPEPEPEPAPEFETYYGKPILTRRQDVAGFLARGLKDRGHFVQEQDLGNNVFKVSVINTTDKAYNGFFLIGDEGVSQVGGFYDGRRDKQTFMRSEARIVLNDAIINVKGDFSGEVDPGRIGNPYNLNKTPALPHERIHGGKNRPGIASRPANVDVGATMERQLRKMQRQHNKANPDNKVTLKQLKSVCHRGRGAYSTSHRPGVSRDGWCIARVKAFLHLVATGEPKNPAYTQDNDLIENNPAAVPPLYMQRAAQLSLALSERFPHRDGMTRTGKEQRRRIAAGVPLSEQQVKKLYSFLSRSAVWADAAGAESRGFFGDKANPSRGYIAILGWGGDGGERARNWAERQLDKWEA